MVRPFVDRPVADLSAATSLAVRAAAHWGLEPPSPIRHGMNVIFAAGDAVIRVSGPTAPPEAALELAASLLRHDLPVPRPARHDVVAAGELSSTCWERIAVTDQPIDWVSVGKTVRRVHDLDPAELPPTYPLPSPADFPWWDFDALLADTSDDMDAAASNGLRRAVGRWTGWQHFTDVRVCHGDVHPGNVMMTETGPILIDWDLLCRAPRAWDHGPVMTWTQRWGGEPGIYESFAAGYGESMRDDPTAEAFAELRLVAATLMRVKAGRTDPTASAEARRRLAYWRGDRDAPAWSAQ